MCWTSLGALWLGCGLPLPGEAEDGEAGDAEGIIHRGKNQAALTRAGSCDDVLDAIQTSVVARLIERAEELRQPPTYYYGEPGIIIDGGELLPPPPAVSPVAAPPDPAVPAGESLLDAAPRPDASQNALSPELAGSSGFSTTTVQVRDVDEADIVKTEGDLLYLLHGSSLVTLQGWPANETAVLGSVAIEGSPLEMFVHEGKVLVYSQVYRDVTRSDPYGYPYSDYGYGYYPYGAGYTKLTLIDMSGEEAEVLRETYLEGYYASSRRHGDVVRTIVQNWSKAPVLDGVYIEYFTPFGEPYRQQDIDAQVDAWLERTIWAVGESEIGDWLPRQVTMIDGAPVEGAPDCAGYYEPPNTDLSQSGVTSVVSLDLSTDDGESALDSVTVLANAERVYANDDVVLLSQTEYGAFDSGYSERTLLHRFDIDGAETVYSASGVLPGYVHSQFSLDEHEGWIRVSTTENVWSSDTGEQLGSRNRVFTLGTSRGWLDIRGQTEVFGQGERIFATRFIGDLGYVVTFRQVDPLFVVDLRAPRRPRVVGELHIPGFSNFLYPLDDGHLLSIGRDATPEGIAQGIALQVFDVTEPSAPALAHKYVYEGDGYSSAEADHRAISFHPDESRISFPVQNWQTGASSLEVFDVSAETGFDRLGAIVPVAPELTWEECALRIGYQEADLEWLRSEMERYPEYEVAFLSQCRFQEQMRRGIFRDDYVYGITNLGVYAHTIDGLDAEPVGQASLPPEYGYYYPYSPGVMVGAGGGFGVGGGSFEGQAGTAMAASGEGGSNMAGGMAGSGIGGSGMGGSGGAPTE